LLCFSRGKPQGIKPDFRIKMLPKVLFGGTHIYIITQISPKS